MPYYSFSSHKYFENRMKTLKSNLNEENMAEPPNDLDNLIIKGKSQFDAEVDQVLNDNRGPTGVYKKLVTKNEDDGKTKDI